MKKHFAGLVCLLLLLSVTIISWKPAENHGSTFTFNKPVDVKGLFEKYISNIYESANLQESGLAQDVFKKALTGFINLKLSNKLPQNSSILTIVDFSISSCQKRMWIIDVINKTLILNTWVAHGQGSGEDMATRFSDRNDSHESSLGFYVTDDVYYGKHGRSLRLDGMDAGFNANARSRAIVVHAADYVSESNIAQEGHLGRSFGCPAVAPEVVDLVIDSIKDKTAIFINGNSDRYSSKYLDEGMAANFILADPANNFIANL